MRAGLVTKAKEYRPKIADWEAGALYWTCRRSHGDAWEAPFRAMLENRLPAADLMFLMGTIAIAPLHSGNLIREVSHRAAS
jgi:hypothetical protein